MIYGMKIEWPTRLTRELLFSLSGLFALIPIHIAGFGFRLPSSLQIMLDLSFKAELAFQFALTLAVSLFLGRYMPAIAITMEATVRLIAIYREYRRRGYSRARPQFFRSADVRRKSFAEAFLDSQRMTRFDRRFENFVKRRIQDTTKINSYDKYKAIVTSVLAVVFMSIYYVGIVRCSLVCLMALVSIILFIIYDEYGDDLFWRINGGNESGDSADLSLNVRAIPAIIATLVISSGVLGYLRCDYLIYSAKFYLNDVNSETKLSIVAKTSMGFVIYDHDRSEFGFVSADNMSLVDIK